MSGGVWWLLVVRTLETRVLLVAVIPVFAGPVSDRTGLTSLYISVTQPECNYKLISREHRGKNLIFICLSLTLSLSLSIQQRPGWTLTGTRACLAQAWLAIITEQSDCFTLIVMTPPDPTRPQLT